MKEVGLKMNTVIDNLKEMSNEIQSNLGNLLINHSSIYRWNITNSTISVLSPSGDYAFEKLKDEGMQIQAKILNDYRKLHSHTKDFIKRADRRLS
jgi:hypothetical protein